MTLYLDYTYALGYPFTVPADFVRILQSPSHAINFVEVSVAIKTLSSQVFHVIKLLKGISRHNLRHGYEPLTLWIENDPALDDFIDVFRILEEFLKDYDLSMIKIKYHPYEHL